MTTERTALEMLRVIVANAEEFRSVRRGGQAYMIAPEHIAAARTLIETADARDRSDKEVPDLITAARALVKLLDDYERDCGEAINMIEWSWWLKSGAARLTEQQCINARIALRRALNRKSLPHEERVAP